MVSDIESRVLTLLHDHIRIGNCLLVNKAWSQRLLNSHVLAQYRKARLRAADHVDVEALYDEYEDNVDVELIVRYRTEKIHGTLLGMSIKMSNDILDINTPIHEGLADGTEQIRQLALKEGYTVVAKLATKETRLPLGYGYMMPEPHCTLHEQPWCHANYVYRRFAKAHKLGLV